jgi:hypothetical protein
MTIKELRDQLDRLIAEDEYRADAQVTFGPETTPVLGGLMGRSETTGLAVLNLAPLKLDRIGGF